MNRKIKHLRWGNLWDISGGLDMGCRRAPPSGQTPRRGDHATHTSFVGFGWCGGALGVHGHIHQHNPRDHRSQKSRSTVTVPMANKTSSSASSGTPWCSGTQHLAENAVEGQDDKERCQLNLPVEVVQKLNIHACPFPRLQCLCLGEYLPLGR